VSTLALGHGRKRSHLFRHKIGPLYSLFFLAVSQGGLLSQHRLSEHLQQAAPCGPATLGSLRQKGNSMKSSAGDKVKRKFEEVKGKTNNPWKT
jgi:hypothetical protein